MAVVKLLLISCLVSLAYSYSVMIRPGTKSCFGQYLKPSEMDEEGLAFLEAEVSKGGDVDISYEVLDPWKNVVNSGNKVRSINYQFNVTREGEYQVCLDNSFSRAFKIVSVEFNIAKGDVMQVFLDKFTQKQEKPTAKGLAKEFKDTLQNLLSSSDVVERFETMNAAKKRRHYFLVENNLSRVNGFSFVSCVIMIAVGVLQVFIVKSLFEEGSRKKFKFFG
eukprot:gene16653-18343_t